MSNVNRFVFVLFLLMTCVACGNSEENNTNDMSEGDMKEDIGVDMGPVGTKITVATFNVKQLFDRTCDSGRCESGDFEKVPSINDYDSKIRKIQDAIRILDADVLIFQEIEKQSLLTEVMMPYADKYPTQVFGEIGGSATIDVAVVTKGRFLEKKTHRQNKIMTANGSQTSFAREFLEVHSEIKGIRVIAFGAHFVSKVSDNGTRRLAEANAAASLLSFRGKDNDDALVVLGGDLNDSPSSAPLRAFSSAGISSVSEGMGIDEFYTHRFNDQNQAIDYVLFWNRDGVDLVRDEVRAFHDEGRTGFSSSDHAAVRASFIVR